jgi:hypothetical protein
MVLSTIHQLDGGNSLERCGILPPPHTARAVDARGADGAAGIAVATAVGHALGARVRVDVVAVGARRAEGHSAGRVRQRVGAAQRVGHGLGVVLRLWRVVLVLGLGIVRVGEDGIRVGPGLAGGVEGMADVGQRGVRRQLWRHSGDVCLPLLLRRQPLLLLDHLALGRLLAPEEAEAGSSVPVLEPGVVAGGGGLLQGRRRHGDGDSSWCCKNASARN